MVLQQAARAARLIVTAGHEDSNRPKVERVERVDGLAHRPPSLRFGRESSGGQAVLSGSRPRHTLYIALYMPGLPISVSSG